MLRLPTIYAIHSNHTLGQFATGKSPMVEVVTNDGGVFLVPRTVWHSASVWAMEEETSAWNKGGQRFRLEYCDAPGFKLLLFWLVNNFFPDFSEDDESEDTGLGLVYVWGIAETAQMRDLQNAALKGIGQCQAGHLLNMTALRVAFDITDPESALQNYYVALVISELYETLRIGCEVEDLASVPRFFRFFRFFLHHMRKYYEGGKVELPAGTALVGKDIATRFMVSEDGFLEVDEDEA